MRKGQYPAQTITKPITLLGEAGAEFDTRFADLVIQSIPRGSSFTLRGFTFRMSWGVRLGHMLAVKQCSGRIALADLSFEYKLFADLGRVVLLDSTAVTMDRCRLHRKFWMLRSNAVITATEFTLLHTSTVSHVGMDDSTATLVQCTSKAGFSTFGYAAVRCNNTRLTIRGDSGSWYQTQYSRIAAIRGDNRSDLVYDPDVRFATKVHAGFRSAIARHAPFLLSSGGKFGGRATAQLRAGTGHVYHLFLGRSGSPLPIPGWGAIWVHPRDFIEIARGLHGPGGSTDLSWKVPTAPGLLGAALTFQTLSGTPGAFELSNPSTLMLFDK